MKKIIILIAMLCTLSLSAQIDYNIIFQFLGKCEVDNNNSEFRKLFFNCDSGYVYFNFNEDEIFVEYNGLPKNGHKRTLNTLFNRGWYKTNQSHKEKSVIVFLSDEFGEIIASKEEKWNGDFYDFYEKFKEKVIYKTESTNTTKNDEEYVSEGDRYTGSNNYLHYHFDTDGKPVCDTGYYWTKYGDRCTE